MKSLTERRAELTKRRNFLLERLDSIEAEFDAHDAKDFAEMATERETDEVLEDLGQSSQHELRMIEAAFLRLENDEYGICARCGETIDEGRLDLIPATPFCAACAAKV